MLCALIMAGGKGTRFWPLSTEEKPKQFLNLIGEETMIQMTVNRILPIVPVERIFICTSSDYINLVKEQIPLLPTENIILEPEGRNTTPCIALSAFMIKRRYGNINMLVLPADHLIQNEARFRKILKFGDSYVENNLGSIITLGMKVTRSETGYGYIKYGNKVEFEADGLKAIRVECFKEKPSKEIAEEYYHNGGYLWNGGMFIWNINNILKNIKIYSNQTFEALKGIESIDNSCLESYVNLHYSKTENISIDYSILEKADNICVIPSDIKWDDIGSWEALDRYRPKDENGNILVGEVNTINCENNLAISFNQQIIIDSVSNIYVIENDGKIIIGHKSKVPKIKDFKKII